MGARAELHGEDPEASHTPAGALHPRRRARRGPATTSEVAGRQEKVERHFVEHLAEFAPMVQILDAPVPQTGGDVTDTLRILDFPIAEQVIDVPKISCSPCPSRSPVPVPQSAEQLVEVPTVLSPTRIALRIAEQIVDTPVPRGRGQGFLPEQGSTATTSSLERISEQIVSSSLTFLLLVVAWVTGLPHLLVLQMRGFYWGFSHFSPWEKVRSLVRTRVRGCPPVSARPCRTRGGRHSLPLSRSSWRRPGRQ